MALVVTAVVVVAVVGSRHAKVLGSSPATPHSVLINRFAGSALGKLPGGMADFNDMDEPLSEAIASKSPLKFCLYAATKLEKS